MKLSKRRIYFYTFLIFISFILGASLSSVIDITKDGKAVTKNIGKNVVKEATKGKIVVFPSFSDLAKELNPSVVNISTTQIIKRRRTPFPWSFPGPFNEEDPFRDFFDRFFGDIPQRDLKRQSLGSGFIINKDGYILTNNHVIENADQIKVKLSDEEEFDAKIIGKDPKTDIALIKINPKKPLPVAKLGDSDKLEVGEWVLAIGNPFGLEHTVTAGIVSAKGRVIGAGPYDNFIQTDASINPGNSGGPLFNIKGEVIGINTAIIAGGQGIGFAIPINTAKSLLPQLKKSGKVIRGWLGVIIQQITPDLAKSFKLKEPRGALVADVIKNSPAEKAGLKRGDIIIEYNDKKINKMNELPILVANTPVGKVVTMKILRNNKEKTIKAKIGEYPEEEKGTLAREKENKLGFTVEEITPQIARRLGLRNTKGVVITQVIPGSGADYAGLRRGDVIEEINRRPVNDIRDYQKIMSNIKPGESVLLLIKRGENTFYVTLQLEK
jgi:serine protease Do